MQSITCPHCQAEGHFKSDVPKDVIAVLPCPVCQELVVLFRTQPIALNRRILESGSITERKEHLAEVIGEFLEVAGGFPLSPGAIRGISAQIPGDTDDEDYDYDPALDEAISEQEFDKFVRIDLKCIDNGAYFRRHFG